MKRGDVLLLRFPHPSGARGKKRPVVVVQADAYNNMLQSMLVAEITSNLTLASDPACLYIDISTPEGQATGLLQNSVVSCLLIATVNANRVDQAIGVLSQAMQQQLDNCLKAALQIP